MTNKLKGLLIGFTIIFSITLYSLSEDGGFKDRDIIEKTAAPFFAGVVGGIFGWLIGASIREKTN